MNSLEIYACISFGQVTDNTLTIVCQLPTPKGVDFRAVTTVKAIETNCYTGCRVRGRQRRETTRRANES